MSGGRVVTLSPSQTQISTDKTAIAADGTEVLTVFVTVKNTDETGGEPNAMSSLRANAVTITATPSTGVVITQPSGTCNASGSTTATLTSTNAATIAIGASVLGVTVTSGSPSVVVGGGAPPDPEPGDPFFTQGTTEATARANADGFTWGSGGSRVTVAEVPAGRTGWGLRYRFGPDADGADSSAEQRFNTGRSLSHLWIEYDIYIPPNYIHRNSTGPDNNKFLALWRDTYSDVTGGTWRIFHELNRGGDTNSTCRMMSSRWDLNSATDTGLPFAANGSTMISPSGPIAIGAWTQVRYEFKAASAYGASDGIIRVWFNGTLFGEMTNGKFWNFDTATDPVDCVLKQGYFMGWSNSGFLDETLLYTYGAKFYDTDPGWL
jgi:hypothetical protein